jgi:very-short-patch-repair endonuclease
MFEQPDIHTIKALWDSIRGDSPLEELFWHRLSGTEQGWQGAIDQFEIGNYRADAILDINGHAVIVELDGKAYHHWERDFERDSVLLNEVSAVIRIPYAALKQHTFGTFKILEQWYSRFRLPDNSRAMTLDEFRLAKSEARETQDGLRWSDWIESVNSIWEIWETHGDVAFVGSPNQYHTGVGMHRIAIRRGKTNPEIIKRIHALLARRREAWEARQA